MIERTFGEATFVLRQQSSSVDDESHSMVVPSWSS